MSEDAKTDTEENVPNGVDAEIAGAGSYGSESHGAEAGVSTGESTGVSTGADPGLVDDALRVPSVEGRSQVHSDDGEPISDEMASAAAVAAVVAIRQVAIAYAAQQAEAAAESETRKGDRAGFRAPRRNVRKRLPQTWDQHLGR
ncbi:hypothetical protein [Brevibacterium spongiae]|uniref:Acyl-CoA carboxylase subunit epsilon n=1 Tax=Brevibacterium spongiae TaxID=2909672 RepID=A0ABY5ST71_9MICO|nr:hypothetical protein [Brevibacterium spongiae]UVI37394.1 hypothetical protein L1F31_07050 [Brevibacterium spongiae]